MGVTISELYGHLKGLNKQWFYEKSEVDASFIQKSNTSGLVRNDGTIDTSAYLTSADISGKVDVSDLSSVATTGSYTNLNNIPETFSPSVHSHSATEVTDANAHSNLGTSANANQHLINSAIDTKFGELLSVDLVTVVSDKGTASANTMNKLYLVAESSPETNDSYEIFVTVRTGTSPNYSYAWEKVDNARIDLSGYSPIDHYHGNITSDGKVGSNADYFVTTTTGGAVTSKQKVGNIDTAGKIGVTEGKVIVTTTNGVLTTSAWIDEVDNIIQALSSYGNSL